jgi:hypothetical protein
MHATEVDTDISVVARLLKAQFAHWADLPIEPVDSSGTDNAIYRLGDDIIAEGLGGHRNIKATRKGERLAIVECFQLGKFISVLLDCFGDVEEQLSTLMRPHVRPFSFIKGFSRSLYRFVDVGLIASATSANISSLAGLTVSKFLPDLAATQLPLISSFLGACRNFIAARFFTPRAALSTEIEAAIVFSSKFQLSTVH